ncbi:MAG: hypothetical protein AAF412_03270 [Pseudomonadota bacterium]
MQTLNGMKLDEIVVRCEELIACLGISLQSGRDFEIFKFFSAESDRETPMDPIFSPTESDIQLVNGLWLLGRNRSGEVVQTQAMRMLDLQGGNLTQFMTENISQIRPHGYDVDVHKTRWRLSPSASRISGRVMYHGGLWIRRDQRGGSLTTLITRYLMAKVLLELDPDFIFGLQAPFVACRGLSAREGYPHLEQRSILWHLNNTNDVFEDWIVWTSREDAEFNLSIPPDEFYAMYEKSSVPVLKSA